MMSIYYVLRFVSCWTGWSLPHFVIQDCSRIAQWYYFANVVFAVLLLMLVINSNEVLFAFGKPACI